MCGSRPLRHFEDDWHSSYEPPVRGHRHYRWIGYARPQELCGTETPVFRKRSKDWLVPFLTVVAFLLLIGLSTGVALVLILSIVVIWLFLALLRRRSRFLELAHARLDFVDETNVLVVLHHTALCLIVAVANGAGPKIDTAHIAESHSCETQRHR